MNVSGFDSVFDTSSRFDFNFNFSSKTICILKWSKYPTLVNSSRSGSPGPLIETYMSPILGLIQFRIWKGRNLYDLDYEPEALVPIEFQIQFLLELNQIHAVLVSESGSDPKHATWFWNSFFDASSGSSFDLISVLKPLIFLNGQNTDSSWEPIQKACMRNLLTLLLSVARIGLSASQNWNMLTSRIAMSKSRSACVPPTSQHIWDLVF